MSSHPDSTGALHVAAIQMNARDDKARNLATALDLVDRAAASGARMVVLPEVWNYMGNPAGIRENAEPLDGPIVAALSAAARRHGIYLHGGSIHELVAGDPRVRNTTVVFDPAGEVIATYSKIHLFDVELAGGLSYRESDSVLPGDEVVTVEIDGWRVGLAICYDLRFPELFRILALQGAEVITLPAAFTVTTGKDHWEVLIRARAIENGVYMVAAGQFGQDPSGKWTYGRTTVVDPWGLPLAVAPDIATFVEAHLDRAEIARVRSSVPSLANRMPDRYRWPDPVGARVKAGG